MRKTIITAFAALIATGTFAGSAAAEQVSVPVTVNVPVSDLDLSTAQGMDTLNTRVNSAIGTVCERPFIRDLRANVAWEECKADARSGALDQVAFVEQPFAGVALASRF